MYRGIWFHFPKVRSTVLTINRLHPVSPDQRSFRDMSACRKGTGGHLKPSLAYGMIATGTCAFGREPKALEATPSALNTQEPEIPTGSRVA
jgi:hypothetical protein